MEATTIQEMLQSNRAFWTRLSAAIAGAIGLMKPDAVACTVQRLLDADLLELMAVCNDPRQIESVQKMCGEVWPHLDAILMQIRKSSMFLGSDKR